MDLEGSGDLRFRLARANSVLILFGKTAPWLVYVPLSLCSEAEFRLFTCRDHVSELTRYWKNVTINVDTRLSDPRRNLFDRQVRHTLFQCASPRGGCVSASLGRVGSDIVDS